MKDTAPIRSALATVLADPVMARSPVLARLLAYLVETTIGGQANTLKSYSVAVDGLGRSPDFDPHTDAYPRVQVARLRRVLDAFYANSGRHLDQRLLIDSGSYEVRLVPNEPPSGPRIGSLQRWPRRTNWLMAAGFVAGIVFLAVGIMEWRAQSAAEAERWKVSDFPFVDVNVLDENDPERETDLAREIRQQLIMKLDKYDGIRVSYEKNAHANYSITVKISHNTKNYDEDIFIVDNKLNRLLWSTFRNDIALVDFDKNRLDEEYIEKLVFFVAHPTGVIHSNERRRINKSDTPYGCWLRFTGLIQSNQNVGDGALEQCAQDWHSAAPNHPLASALYGWTLINRSIFQTTESSRRETIQDAVDVLEGAKAVNPNSPFLQISAMRANAFAGNIAAMHQGADRALELNPDNLDILGAAGMLLALQNDPQGEVLLNKAIAQHFNPPPWYFVGTFIAAMMRQDIAGAGQSLDRLRPLQHSLPILPILSAAYEARRGRLDRACSAWGLAVKRQSVLGGGPAAYLVRLPLRADVRSRLLEWLGPVLDNKCALLPLQPSG